MIGLFEKKKPFLFTLSINLDVDDDAKTAAAKTVKLKPDGSAYVGLKKIGQIPKPLWDYLSQFEAPKEMQRVTYNCFDIDVHGDVDRANVAEHLSGHPYTYACGSTLLWPRMIPHAEYSCELIDKDDHFDIAVAGEKIGVLGEVEERKRLGKLRSMLKSGFKTTAKIAPQNTHCDLFVNLYKA